MIVRLQFSALREVHWYEFAVRFALGGAIATMSHAAAINSVMRATPFGVIIWVTSDAEVLIGAFLWQVFAVTYDGA
jgi:hypothetical protein